MSNKSTPPVLFIGRWQPFHAGHKKLIETELKKGNDVIIACRDTAVDEKNPLTYLERADRIHAAMAPEWKWRYRIILIPDISAVAYGRDVGYDVREIKLDAETEAISGTKIRKEMGL